MIGATLCIGVCAAGSHSAPGASACVDCPAGKSDVDQDPTTACADCNVGRYSGAAGAVECVTVCTAGSYSASSSDTIVATTVARDCEECPAGKSDADQDPTTACVDCAAGRYSEAAGVSETECTGACAAGSHSTPGASAATVCVDCPAGKSDADQDPTTVCADCNVGRYSEAAGAIECDGACPENTPYSPPGSTVASACGIPCGALEAPCALGFFCASEGPGATGTCAACTSGECGCTDKVATNDSPTVIYLDTSCAYDCDAAGWECIPAATARPVCANTLNTVCAASGYVTQPRLELGDPAHRIIHYADFNDLVVRRQLPHTLSHPQMKETWRIRVCYSVRPVVWGVRAHT